MTITGMGGYAGKCGMRTRCIKKCYTLEAGARYKKNVECQLKEMDSRGKNRGVSLNILRR